MVDSNRSNKKEKVPHIQFGMSSFSQNAREQFGQNLRLAMACIAGSPTQSSGIPKEGIPIKGQAEWATRLPECIHDFVGNLIFYRILHWTARVLFKLVVVRCQQLNPELCYIVNIVFLSTQDSLCFSLKEEVSVVQYLQVVPNLTCCICSILKKKSFRKFRDFSHEDFVRVTLAEVKPNEQPAYQNVFTTLWEFWSSTESFIEQHVYCWS